MEFEGLEKRVSNRGTISYWRDGELLYKYCNKCGEVKKVEMFGNDKTKKDGKYSSCKECRKKYQKETEEHIKEYRKRYWQESKIKNSEKIIESRKKHYKKHKERIREKQKKYRDTNKELIKIIGKKWCENNKEHLREYKMNYSLNVKKKMLKTSQKMLEEINLKFKELRLPIYGSIYKITHTNGRCYIGQTTQPLELRYKGGIKGWIKERKEKANQKFLRDFESEKEFTLEIIDVGCCQYHLDKMESFYIDKYDSFNNGYNNNIGNYKTDDGLEEFNQILNKYNLEFIDGELRRIV